MIERILVGVLALGAWCWASGGETMDISQTDIVERVLNFILFMGILWYAMGGALKKMLLQRRARISEKLSSLQEERQAIKEEKEQVLRSLEEAKQKASQILSNAKQEAYLLTQKHEQLSKIAIEKLIKNHQSLMDKEEVKVQQEVIDEVLEELFKSKQAHFNLPTYMHLLHQRVIP
ncbi:F0F1 ATP synthase subunit B family protein [Helicobacter bizzozeronii]|uniref:F0F1 ATP synthase subunit B family protein n=1 Tax=Helicobacter bizzozeronii TaxID=56877 RepID=UPI0018F83469|nr:hypothetical protein [Helicobacter bizzozeronii]